MDSTNKTSVEEFVLLGFGIGQHNRLLLLIFFTFLYVLTLAENITIIILVFLDTHLGRLPMYILLSNFSWLEMCYVSSIVPRMIFDLAVPGGIISFKACLIQFYIFFILGGTECFFLSIMALDRYMAICHPLHYPQIMSQNVCYILVALCWILGFLWYLAPAALISKLSFCGSNVIDHFLCDAGPILSLACPPLGIVPTVSQMDLVNETTVQEFILLGLERGQQWRFYLLILFSFTYIITLIENTTIIILVHVDEHLVQLPMYILLGNFSWLEMCY
ncbi:Olfactory receptor 11G2, partial [Ophiophagus hannah]